MSHRIRTLLAAAVVACCGLPANANSLQEPQRIDADCSGYTITFVSTDFAPGDSINVTYTVELIQSGVPIVYTGSATITDADGVPVATKVVTEPWGIPMCGRTNVVDVAFPPSRFDWTNNSGLSGAGVFTFADGSSSKALDCPCTTTEICRTPGFWGTHAGTEKKNSQNITQQVINRVGFLSVCGQTITTTLVKAQTSALEGTCVSVQGDQKLQLARQLTAASLNCAITNGGANCAGTSIAATFATCNNTCLGMPSGMSLSDCISAIDCFNNGGSLMSNGLCAAGTCGGDGVTVCSSDDSCLPDPVSGEPVSCVGGASSCHDRPLVNTSLGLNFEPPGSAGSSRGCNDARKNSCTIFNCPAK